MEVFAIAFVTPPLAFLAITPSNTPLRKTLMRVSHLVYGIVIRPMLKAARTLERNTMPKEKNLYH
jgi:hypothetical protein